MTHGQTIKDLKTNQSVALLKVEAGGSLEVRRLRTGPVMFYWRHTSGKVTQREPIGVYDSSAPPKSLKPTGRGYSITAALEAARDLAKRDAEVEGGLRAEKAREDAAAARQRAAELQQQQHTLKALCIDYCDWLEAAGKDSHSDARNIFKNHVFEAFPDIAGKPAAAVEKREVVLALRKLTEAGKATTARKLRAYLRAAYACAAKADSDATLPARFIEYQVTVNPVDTTAAIKGASDKNPLTLPQLRTYWTALATEPAPIGAALRLQILTGGQRIAQLARLHDDDITDLALKLLDPKGKRDEPREHFIPVTKAIQKELAALPHGFRLSTDGGITPMHPSSLSTWAGEIAERAGINDFQLKRVRSGIETALAAAGVSRDIRGQLQSHGLGGVQDRHYDAHTYLAEKRQALDTLFNLLTRKEAAKVVRMKRSA